MNLSCRANSIMIIGERGVGKTLVAEKLAEITNLPVINFEELIFLPKNIFSQMPSFTNKQKEYCERMERLRKMFPDLRNANDFGYSKEIATKIKDKYGENGLEIYIKYFEMQIFNQFIESLTFPVIIDTNSNLPNYEDIKMENFLKKVCAENVNLYKKGFKNHRMLNTALIAQIFQKVGKIIYLYKNRVNVDSGNKSVKEKLKNYFNEPSEQSISEKIATKRIDANLLIINNKLDESQLNLMVAKILDKKECQKAVETPPTDTSRIEKISLILR